MTKQTFSLVVLITLLFSSCNTEKNREIFNDFEGEEGIYMIKLPPALFLTMLDSELKQESSGVGNIDFVKLLVFDESLSSDRNSGELLSEIRDKFDKYGYEMAIQFSNSGNDISAYLLENENYVTDLMVVINNDQGVVGLGLSGKLNAKAVLNFASDVDYGELKDIIDIEGFGL